MIKSFRELEVWQKADELAHRVFDLTETFPKEYMFDLTAQLRRAALSVPTNIAEGSATAHTKELLQFISVSRRSARETQYLLLFALRRELITVQQHQQFEGAYEEVQRMLNGLTRALRQSPMTTSRRLSRVAVTLLVFLQFFTDHYSLITDHSIVFADVPRTIHYQGKLTEPDGSPITGDHTVTLRLYDAATGGTALWEEAHQLSLVRDDNGVFSVVLGSQTPFSSSITFNEPLWLTMEVDGGGEFSPRQPLSAVSYAINADTLDGLDSTQLLSSGGSGGSLTDLNASNLTTGTVPDARLSSAVSLLGATIESAEVTDSTLTAADTSDAFLTAGVGVTITKGASSWDISAVGSGGDVTAVSVGTGLTGGGTSGDVTVALSTPVAVGHGGTGASTASAARTNLGVAASGANSDIASLSGLTIPLSISQGGTGASTAAEARANLINCLPIGGVHPGNENSTFQIAVFGPGDTTGRPDHLWPAPVSGNADTFRAFVGQAPGAGDTWTVTLRKNDANTALSCTISGASQTTCTDTGAVSFAAGDRLGVQFVESGTAANTLGAGWSVCFVPD